MPDTQVRCSWVTADPLYIAYHDTEWGVPQHDPHALFECLTLEGAQAGLSWLTILRKREGYRRAFAGFDPEIVARFTDQDLDRLLGDPGIVRHRGKIEATIGNARAWLALIEQGIDPARWLWSFASDAAGQRPADAAVQSTSPASDRMSKALRKAGFRFVGSTTCYAFMQATGMVNDHHPACFRHAGLAPSAAGVQS
ncbi:DNA-3-methyladenine glycosylase I [Niveibacterium sp. 24ML]|uniref:DNA-3-methyladenine glycosylase I n=1 Tax=Niveibacterium sp. 24ML TaxID=2985512 RepID=UPI0022721918|nr:DNA-3-methyladenine glycosylase I [Niveibacterium sp. 24ML]MCX9156583.1 DNA-3-methyladenine glycosylase I [Niveibacterium sp. 24ML]